MLKSPGTVRKDLQKDENLFRQGEYIQYVYYLTSGCINRAYISEKGDQVIYSSLLQNSIAESLVGVLAIFSPDGRATTDFVAITPCTGYLIPRQEFLDYTATDPELLMDIIRYAVLEYRELADKFQVRHEKKIANKICSMYYSSMRRNKTGEMVIVGVRNVEIASYLGVHSVTVSRVLHALREEGVLEKYTGGWMVQKPEQLRKYADGAQLVYR